MDRDRPLLNPDDESLDQVGRPLVGEQKQAGNRGAELGALRKKMADPQPLDRSVEYGMSAVGEPQTRTVVGREAVPLVAAPLRA